VKNDIGILVKVDRRTRESMREVGLNWSEEIRNFISKKLLAEKDRNLARAVATTDKLFRKSKHNFNSTEFIRNTRAERYGPDSNRR
jgi:hypothetical protein